MNELALFAGAGGGILGGHLLGWRTVCAVERDAYAAAILAQRQNDGLIEPFPIWSDVCTFDGKPWRGIVDVVSGGFPCQDISAAGKGAGIDGDRSGLWSHMARIIDEVRPGHVFVENSPLLVSRGLVRVLGDLTEMGFDARWGIVGAHHVGAPHKRERCWIVANAHGGRRGESQERQNQQSRGTETVGPGAAADADGNQCEAGIAQQGRRNKPGQAAVANGGDDMADSISHRRIERRNDNEEYDRGVFAASHENHDGNADSERLEKRQSQSNNYGTQQQASFGADWWTTEPDVGRVAHGVAARVDRLRAIGNGQVPLAAATAWRFLSKNL